LARAVFGIDRLVGGGITLGGMPVVISGPRDAIDRGIYLIPEDRKRAGLIVEDSVVDNISLPDLPAYATLGLVSTSREKRNAESQVKSLRIKVQEVDALVASLSGGNQQKVVLAKWLSMKPKVLIFDEPTRGVDVGAKTEIYELMRALTDRGVAILMISSDLEEVIGVSDRMAVMHEGAIAGILERSEFSQLAVMHLAVGQVRG